ncbi:MAG: hypothetical protein UW62_C0027G0001 [Candidatus Collierbacteria bacterium GW2011_GWB1_44_35]|uniref:CxxC-x17-CxxC domain-containing protein n=1 Tax=Candidatus Collierbacteria bacterium GW2011_GWB1_44_35 TaxID=1618383 RepID=A0A0G1J6Q3_9BACT|nr:MAG: hypothetical protein UW62_C0027G0001 [Candidatus Collierbacteria bacterium GW2011_GWB1_44_35]
MTFSNRGGYGGNRGQNFRASFNSRGSERPAMFDAVCAKCGADCQVPFRPNGRKEVFCSKCFETNGGESRSSGDFRDSSCDECGENCKVPFQPRNGNPVLCSNCFANKKEGGSRSSSSSFPRPSRDNSVDLEVINAKLDKLIKLLTLPEEPKAKVVDSDEAIKVETNKVLEVIQASIEKKAAKKAPKKSVKKTTKSA